MAKTITQKITFKNTAVKDCYDLYMNEKKHSEVTGGPTKISDKEGTSFNVYDGYITGKNLQLIKDKLIVQSWHGSDWDADEIDSTFILLFEQKGRDVIVYVTHANLPDKHAESIDKGWHTWYWEPWKNYLAGKTPKPKSMGSQ